VIKIKLALIQRFHNCESQPAIRWEFDDAWVKVVGAQFIIAAQHAINAITPPSPSTGTESVRQGDHEMVTTSHHCLTSHTASLIRGQINSAIIESTHFQTEVAKLDNTLPTEYWYN
jgi:hypothetical protein